MGFGVQRMLRRKKNLDEADLLYVRIELLNRINRSEEALSYVWSVFLIGLGSILATIFLVNANMLDGVPLTVFFAFICLVGSVYVKILYPPRLVRMRETLEQLDEVLKLSPALPRNIKNSMARRFLQTHEDLTHDFMRWVNRISLLKSYNISVGIFAVGLASLITGILQGYPSESCVISGPITVAGVVMIFLKYRERRRALTPTG